MKYQDSAKTGMILVMVVLITSAILAVGLGIFVGAFNQLRSASETKFSFNAFYAADSGADRALYLDRAAAGGPLCSGVPGITMGDGVPDVDCYVLSDFPVGYNACVTVRVSKDIQCNDAMEAGVTRIKSTGLYQCGSGELGVKRAFCLNYLNSSAGSQNNRGDVLRFSARSAWQDPWFNLYRYVTFYNPVAPAHTWAAGDILEYDVYLETNLIGLGGIDFTTTDGGRFSNDFLGWGDQNGLRNHPSADLRAWAFQRWYTRTFAVTADAPLIIGKSVDSFDIVAEFNDEVTTGIAYYDNIVIKDKTGAVVDVIYQSGAPSENTLHLNQGYSSHTLDVVSSP